MTIQEIELSKPVVDLFKKLGYEAYGEVECLDSSIDHVFINPETGNNSITAVELKTTANIDVLVQAVNNQNYARYSYIAIPNKKYRDRSKIEKLCHKLNLGLIYINILSETVKATIVIHPSPNNVDTSYLNKQCRGYKKDLLGGVARKNGTQLITDAKITIFEIFQKLKIKHRTLKELYNCLSDESKSKYGYNWVQSFIGNINWIIYDHSIKKWKLDYRYQKQFPINPEEYKQIV